MVPAFTKKSTINTGKEKYYAMMLEMDTTEYYTTITTKKTFLEDRYNNIWDHWNRTQQQDLNVLNSSIVQRNSQADAKAIEYKEYHSQVDIQMQSEH